MSIIVSLTCSSSASGPQIDSRTTSAKVDLPVAMEGKAAAISPTVSSALQIAFPINSHIFTNNFIIILIINFCSAILKAIQINFIISLNSGIQPNGFSNLGNVISVILLHQGISRSLIKSIKLGLNIGGRGQSNNAIIFATTGAPGNLLNSSSNSKRLS